MLPRRRYRIFRRNSSSVTKRRFGLRRLVVESLEKRLLLSATSGPTEPLTEPPVVVGEIIVGFEGGFVTAYQQEGIVTLEEAVNTIVGDSVLSEPTILANHTASLSTRWIVSDQASVVDLISALSASPDIAFAEPNFVLLETATIPNDPQFTSLWSLNNTGQTSGTVDSDIDAPEAWDLTTGSADIVVGLIDTGVDYTHPDLAANIWTNPGEIPDDSVDNDGNGFVDDVFGWDFVNGDNDPFDDNGHGTHVAGIIAAAGNNSVGVTGVSWTSRIMPLKFLDSTGTGTTAGAVAALSYATAMCNRGVNIRLTNNSWGGGAFSQALSDAIEASGQCDMLFVASAGNTNTDLDATPIYPASYGLDNIIAVTATDIDDGRAGSSNFGLSSVDLAAPGADILSTLPDGQYGTKSGTSMAVPHVSGVAALAWSLTPTANYQRIKNAILDGSDPVASMTGTTVSGGRLNALGTLSNLTTYTSIDTPRAIPDQSTVTSTLTVPDAVTIDDVNVTLDITHKRDQDLDVFLIAPDGTRVELFSDVGGSSDNFSGTTLDDEAVTAVTAGSAPFSGSFRPEGSLAVLDGKDAQGSWSLEITDDRRRQIGTLNSWSIEMTPAQPVLPTLTISNAQLAEGDDPAPIKIAHATGGGPALADGDQFGRSIASIGDLDGDGIDDLAVGAFLDGTGGYHRGAVHILFLNADGSTKSTTKIASGVGGGPPIGNDEARFGVSVASLGDLNGDGVTDIAVGAREEDIGGVKRGSVYVLFLNADGTVDSSTQIASGINGGPSLADVDEFGSSVSAIGDLDGDGVVDLVVGAKRDDTGGTDRGAVYILFMNSDGTVKNSTKIANNTNGGPTLADDDLFSGSTLLGDIDGDGVTDLAVGAARYSRGGHGAVYVLFMNTDGTVKSSTKITHETGGGPSLQDDASFGVMTAGLGDVNGDGIADMAIGYLDGTSGVVSVMFLNADGTVASYTSTRQPGGGFDRDGYGVSALALGDRDGDGIDELAIGAFWDSTGGPKRGAIYILDLNPDGTAKGASIDLTVTRSGDTSGTSTVDFATADGTASVGFDYVAASGTLEFLPGETSKKILVGVNGDTIFEPNETFSVILSNPLNSTIVDTQGQGTILDDEETISIGDATAHETDGNISLDVTLSAISSEPVTVDYTTSDGTATAGSDYTTTSGTLTFAPGVTQQTILIPILDDVVDESPESFFVNLTASAGAVISDNQGTATITEATPGVTVTPISGLSTTEAGGTARFSVVLDSKPTGRVTIRLRTSDPSEGLIRRSNEPTSTTDDLELEFDEDDWEEPEEIEVVGVEDEDDDGDIDYEIIITVEISEDDDYVDVDPEDVELTNLDDDDDPIADELPETKFFVVDSGTDQTFEYKADGSPLAGGNWSLDGGNTNPKGATSISDGSRVWVIDNNDKVYVYDGDGALQTSWTASGLNQAEGIATDGADIWILDKKAKKVLKYDNAATAGDSGVDFTFPLNGANSKAKGITTDGSSIWVVNDDKNTDKVFKYDASDGTLLGSWTIDSANSKPTGLTIDPSGASSSIWIVDNGKDKVYEYGNALGNSGGNLLGSFALASGNTNPQGVADPLTSSQPVTANTTAEVRPVRRLIATVDWSRSFRVDASPVMRAIPELPLESSRKAVRVTQHREQPRERGRYPRGPQSEAADQVFAGRDLDDLLDVDVDVDVDVDADLKSPPARRD